MANRIPPTMPRAQRQIRDLGERLRAARTRTAMRGWKEQARRCGARGAEIAAMDAVIDAER